MTTIGLAVNEKVASYTDLREAANVFVNFLNSASLKEIASASETLSEALTTEGFEDSAITELLLSNTEAVPLIDAIEKKKSDGELALNGISYINAVKARTAPQVPDGFDKNLSLFYHKAQSKVDFASCLTDISAIFCNLVPAVEMSRCVPYFDLRILYPKGSDRIGALNPLRFLGVPADSMQFSDAFGKDSIESKVSEASKIGFDVAGMEIFCMPQTLAASNNALNGVDAVSMRGVNVLNPITPLLSIESANIQQTGINGSLYAQTRIELSMILHDRSRLSDISPLISVDVFPTVNLKVTYGWSHPDTNKMTGNPYAKLINSMKFTQIFAVHSVSLSTRDATSLSVRMSIVSMGNLTAKSAKLATSNAGRVVPYTVLQALVKQYVTLKTNYSKSSASSNDKTITFQTPSKIGSTIVASATPGTNFNKFINTADFYRFYKTLSEIMRGGEENETDEQKVSSIVKALNAAVPINDTQLVNLSAGIFDFREQKLGGLSQFFDYHTNVAPFSAAGISSLIPSALRSSVAQIAQKNGYGVFNSYVPLSCAIGKLVAQPLLNSIPDVTEVRIHCFSFNSACGEMAKENIGNFPIVLSQMQDREETSGDKKKKIAGLNANSSAESALASILAQANNPSSPFYGFSSIQKNLDEAVNEIKDAYSKEDPETLPDDEAKAAKKAEFQARIDQKVSTAQGMIQDENQKILIRKNVGAGQDPAFIPPRIKAQIDVVEAYSANDEAGASTKKIIRIMVYDERAAGFNKLANLVFAMANSNGIAKVINPVPSDLKDFITVLDDLAGPSPTPAERANKEKTSMIALSSKKDYRDIATRLYPNLIIGSDSGCIINATFSSQPSGDVASSYLLTAVGGDTASTGTSKSATNSAAADVLIIPSTITINMLGNVCISRGQTYYVDFGTGTTLDQAYTVSAVSHAIKPGGFTTTVTMIPSNNATVKSVDRQIEEFTRVLKNTK